MQARREILSRLHSQFETIGDGGMACIVSGSPGVGKTFLVKQFLAELPTETPRLLGGGSRTGVAPLLPICDAIRSFGEGQNADQLRRVVEEEFAELLPGLRPILGSRPRKRNRRQHEPPAVQSIIPSETHTFFVLSRVLKSLGRSRTPVLFIDDVQWIDAASIGFLAYLIKQIHRQRVLLLLARRVNGQMDDQVARLLETVRHDAGERSTEFVIDGLTPTELVVFLQSILGSIEFSKDELDWFMRCSQGKPYYLEQVIEVLRDDGRLTQRGGVWQLHDHSEELLIPPALEYHLRERLLRATEGDALARKVLQFAACLGTAFDARVVADALGESAREVGVRLGVIEKKTGIIQRQGRQTLFRFDHDLTREAVLAELGDFAREIHGELATTLAKQKDTQPALVAYQFEAAGDRAAAAEWYGRAAEQAARDLLFDAAQRYGEKVDSLHAATGVALDAPARVQAATIIGHALVGQERYEQAVQFLLDRVANLGPADAVALRHLCGRAAARVPLDLRHHEAVAHLRAALAAVPAGNAKQRAEILLDLVYAHDAAGDYVASQVAFQMAEATWRRAPDAATQVRLLRLTCIFWQPEKVVEAIEQAIKITHSKGLRYESALCENDLGSARFSLRQLDRAARHFERSHDTLKRLGGYRRDTPLNNLGLIHVAQRDLLRGHEFLEAALATSHDRHNQIFIRSNLAVVTALDGQLAEAREQLRALAVEADDTGDRFYRDCVRHNLANALLETGHAEEACITVNACPPHHSGGDDTLVEGKRAQLLVRAHEALGRPVPAALAEQAASLARTTKPQAWLFRMPWYLCGIEFWED